MASRQLHHRGFRDGLKGVDADGMPLLRRRRGGRQRGLRVLVEVVMPLVRRRKLRSHVEYPVVYLDLCKGCSGGPREACSDADGPLGSETGTWPSRGSGQLYRSAFLLSQDYQVTPSKPQPQVAVVSKGEVTLLASLCRRHHRLTVPVTCFCSFLLTAWVGVPGVGSRGHPGLEDSCLCAEPQGSHYKREPVPLSAFCFEYTVSMRPACSASLAYGLLWPIPDSGCGLRMVSPWLKPHHSRTGCREELEELEG